MKILNPITEPSAQEMDSNSTSAAARAPAHASERAVHGARARDAHAPPISL